MRSRDLGTDVSAAVDVYKDTEQDSEGRKGVRLHSEAGEPVAEEICLEIPKC